MKKIFVAVVMSVLFVAQTALAMTFQPPVEIGWLGISQVGKGGGGFSLSRMHQNLREVITPHITRTINRLMAKAWLSSAKTCRLYMFIMTLTKKIKNLSTLGAAT